MTSNACRYLRNMEIVDVGAQRFWYLIRLATLRLRHAQAQLLRYVRSYRDICNEERNGEPFAEAAEKLDEQIKDALDAFSFDYIVSTVNAGGLTTKIVSECVAVIKTGRPLIGEFQSPMCVPGQLPITRLLCSD
jgi:hypothetical protein